MMLKCARDLFSLEDHIHYLNNAYMSPNLKSVEMSGVIAVRQKSKPYQITIDHFFDPVIEVKKNFAEIIDLKTPESIAICPSASYGLANIANNIQVKQKKNIVLPAEQFPSNYYIWERMATENNLELRIVRPPSGLEDRSRRWNEAILDAIDGDTLLLACGHVHWSDGTLFDLKSFRTACSSVDAYLIIDGSQSIGALPFSVEEIRPDALVSVGYKWLYGPYGIALTYFGERLINGRPIEESWMNRKDSRDFKNLVNYQAEYDEGASRYSVGEQSNFILVAMLNTALQQVKAWTPEALQHYSRGLVTDYLAAFREMGYFIEEDSGRCDHLLGIRVPEHTDIVNLAERLKERNIYVSVRGDSIRLATSVYNSKRDLDAFLSVLHQAEMV